MGNQLTQVYLETAVKMVCVCFADVKESTDSTAQYTTCWEIHDTDARQYGWCCQRSRICIR